MSTFFTFESVLGWELPLSLVTAAVATETTVWRTSYFFFQIYKLFMFCPIYLVTFPVFFHSVPFPIHPLSWSPHVCIHNIYTCYYTHLWRRKWQPTPAFLPGESRGQRSLAGCSPWGHKKSDMTEQLSTYVSTYYYFLSHLRVNWRLVPFHP